eukprot:scaffold597_cov176-Amphora_coffeaeformis.AAC.1
MKGSASRARPRHAKNPYLWLLCVICLATSLFFVVGQGYSSIPSGGFFITLIIFVESDNKLRTVYARDGSR